MPDNRFRPPLTSRPRYIQDDLKTPHTDLGRAVAGMKQRGIELRNFFGQATDVPSVFGWFPVASIYFSDPDGHLLELLAKLPGKCRPEIGVVSLDEWNRLNQSPD